MEAWSYKGNRSEVKDAPSTKAPMPERPRTKNTYRDEKTQGSDEWIELVECILLLALEDSLGAMTQGRKAAAARAGELWRLQEQRYRAGAIGAVLKKRGASQEWRRVFALGYFSHGYRCLARDNGGAQNLDIGLLIVESIRAGINAPICTAQEMEMRE